jgi:DNA-directed RNA polymerase subunit RPC12/RpoP
MHEITCEQCGRRVTIGGDAVMCPSCGFTLRPAAQPAAAQPAAAQPASMAADISGADTRVAAAPAVPVATAATAAGGQIVCAQCGRSVMTGAVMAMVCPSCGFALGAPVALAATDVSAMETRVAPMPAPTAAASERASGVDAAATRVADVAPIAPAAIVAQADTAATQMAAVGQPVEQASSPQPAEEGASMSPETPETRPAGLPYGQPPAPAPYAGQPGFGQQPEVGQPAYGQQPQPGMPPTATYPYPGYPGGPMPPMMSPAPPPPPSKKTPVALIAVLVALAVIVVAGVLFAALALARTGGFTGAAATATAVPTATATPLPTATPSPTAGIANVPAGFTAYQDPSGLYQIVYPTNWVKTSTSGDFGLTTLAGADSSGHANVFEVEYIKGAAPGTATTVVDTFFSGLANSIHGQVSNKQGPTQVTLSGESWTRESADVTATAAGTTQVQHVVVQVATHGGYTFVIAYLAQASGFDATNTSTFTPMLDSFKFLT